MLNLSSRLWYAILFIITNTCFGINIKPLGFNNTCLEKFINGSGLICKVCSSERAEQQFYVSGELPYWNTDFVWENSTSVTNSLSGPI